jgi:hypothetical protein
MIYRHYIFYAKNNPPDLTLDRQIRYAAGLQYEWSEDITVGIVYAFLDMRAGVNLKGGQLQGDCDPNHIYRKKRTMVKYGHLISISNDEMQVMRASPGVFRRMCI